MAGRPKAPGVAALSREAIVQAAIAEADAGGLPALTMRAVGRRLRVEAMSLYHHVGTKDAMLDAMVDAVFAEFHSPVPDGEWTEELRRRHRSAREALKRHPWAIGLMNARSNPGPETLRHHDAVLGCLRGAGCSLALTGHAFALLDAHLYGFLVQELSLAFQDEAQLAELGEQIFAPLPEGELPHLREYAVERALQPGYSFGDEFEVGLDLVLEGLVGRLAAERAAS